ncbi:glutamate--tRNA ligase [Croceivirga radicis]|uniref:Glutamate--tRNA ligase n=1 Tax=Croceivirga radicis TaxID=1929488 RepID=A0A1V6LVR2_9FLAO|nr:glutamate--tRNA ligase [Croceivirga radicis]OQD44270.1 glutamate--tRNA ligase [Croceivirga radicis]
MSLETRVRFAPSPTGPLHIGGLRTALFNYLYAKKNNGKFILRIEDTDQNRYVEGAENYIEEALKWCGLEPDESTSNPGKFGPYRQSERKHLYKKYVFNLIEKDKAYYAFDTPESLDNYRKAHEAKGKTFIYNWHNREKLDNSLLLTPEETQNKINSGAPYVIRFKSPENRELVLRDEIRGTIKIDTNILDDKILFKSDGMPTYHLANIVDDHLMEITHVIRGEEWLPSLALHYLLYEAFEWTAPKFAHLPLIMKPTGKGKLSKRDGDKGGFPVFPLSWNDSKGYREEGYFPEVVINFLALLGWNPGTEQELFTKKELIEAFSLERVNKSGARFDPEKNKWYNHQYLQLKAPEELKVNLIPILKEKGLSEELINSLPLERIISQNKERANFIGDFWELIDYYFIAPTEYDAKASNKQWKENTPKLMEEVITVIETISEFESERIEASIKQYISQNELGFGQIMPPLRLAIVGAMKGPHLFDIMEIIGKEETIHRIKQAIHSL